ncbi:hypothetical protein [Okeania sp.]|uniref:hypothetical protein n=1 Tax=Okeania sp. TaxID=3100323 RepID=UPI002B4B573B|nr:hypothetical protein [Okeania sp.]MEB3339408.1 hypothetical protein [Okeania sp.]
MASSQPSYSIFKTSTPIIIDGTLDKPAWTAAPDVGALKFPWWQSGKPSQGLKSLANSLSHLKMTKLLIPSFCISDNQK